MNRRKLIQRRGPPSRERPQRLPSRPPLADQIRRRLVASAWSQKLDEIEAASPARSPANPHGGTGLEGAAG
jgi:hypothetical protein